MNKGRIWLLIPILLLGGCGHFTGRFPKLTDEQKIELLRSEARKRGLEWHIFCVEYNDPTERYQGTAWNGLDEKGYDRWMKTADTAANAAYALYVSIQEKPTHPAKKPCCPESNDLVYTLQSGDK